MNTTDANPAITLAVSHEGLGDFYKALLLEFASQVSGTGIIIGDIPNFTSGGDYGDGSYHLENVALSGGVVNSATLSNLSMAPVSGGSDQNSFTVNVTLSGHVTYSNWNEQGYFSSEEGGVVHDDPFNDNYSGFAYDLQSLPMALTVTFAMSDDSMDPLDTSKTLVVTTSGVSTGSASFANPQLPSNSVMNVGSFFNLFPSDGTATVQAALTGTNLVAPFVAAVNTMFQVVPDSGKLTPGLTVLFPPSSMDFPAGGGFRMGVSGRFVAQPSQATFPGTGPDPLPLPNLPATGMTFVCNDFLLNQIGWYASFSGAMNMTLPLDDSLPAQWNTSIFQNQLPALYNFAPDVPFIMTFTSTAEAPTHFTIVPAFQMTPAALATVNPGLPANVLAVLQPYKNQIFPSAEALSGFLNAELTTSDYAAYAASIVAGSSGFGFQVVSIYTVALVVPQHGVKTTAVAFSTVVTHQVDQFGMTNPTATTQAVTFNAMYASSSSYSVTSAPGLPFSVSDLNTLTSLTLDKDIDYVTTLLNKAGQQGASIPALPGFVMRNPSVVVTSNQILVTGDTTPS